MEEEALALVKIKASFLIPSDFHQAPTKVEDEVLGLIKITASFLIPLDFQHFEKRA